MNEKKSRVKWIDIARIIALFAVYMTHTGAGAGFAYSFGFKFAVQTFFLISGCMAFYDKESNYGKYVWKKFKGLMIPYFAFALLAIVLKVLMTNRGFDLVKESLVIVIKGCVRNEFYSAPLWYFTCAFCMEIIFKIFSYIKVKYIPLCLSVVMWALAAFVLPNNPTKAPTLFYNLDSAMYFMIFYGIGYTFYPLLLKVMSLENIRRKIIFAITGSISLGFSMLVFFEHDPFMLFMDTLYLSDFLTIIRSLIIIYSILVISRLLNEVNILNRLGQETLYLCGNEMIIKTLLQSFLEVFGLGLIFVTPVSVYIFNICCFIVGYFIIIRFEKNCAESIVKCFNKA